MAPPADPVPLAVQPPPPAPIDSATDPTSAPVADHGDAGQALGRGQGAIVHQGIVIAVDEAHGRARTQATRDGARAVDGDGDIAVIGHNGRAQIRDRRRRSVGA